MLLIAPTTLQRFYRKHGIKRKRVRQVKLLSATAQANFAQDKQRIIDAMEHARNQHMEVVYMDEVVFSKRGFPTHCYSRKGENITVNQKDVYSGFRTVLAAVNSAMGLVLIDSKEEVTNEKRIMEFIPKLSACLGGEPFALFMDNLSCHKT